MAVGLSPGDALVEQQVVQLLLAPEAQPWWEETLAHQPDVVLDLPLLPAVCGDRLHQVMAAHLQEAAIVSPVLAQKTVSTAVFMLS